MSTAPDYTQHPEWADLPDDETTACGWPLGVIYPDLYDENNKPR